MASQAGPHASGEAECFDDVGFQGPALEHVELHGVAPEVNELDGGQDDSIQSQAPAGCPPFVKDVPGIGVRKGRCDVMFLCVGDGVFAKQERSLGRHWGARQPVLGHGF